MVPEIERKLTVELREPVTTERQVVYILVQMRKLLDRLEENAKRDSQPSSPTYSTLRFYCNWVAHVGLTNTEAKALVANANEIHARVATQKLTEDDKAAMWETYTFAKLRADMDRLIADHNLPAINVPNWNRFIASLLPVLEDCPLTVKSSASNPLEIDKVELRREMGQPDADPNGLPPRIVWGFFHQGQDRLWVTAN